MADRGNAGALQRSLRLFGLTILPVGLFWAAIALAVGEMQLAILGSVACVFSLWLVIEGRRRVVRSESHLAVRVAIATQIAGIAAVTAEPSISTAIAIGALVPILIAMPYVSMRQLTRLMLVSAVTGAFATAAPAILPWAPPITPTLLEFIITSAKIVVYVLFQLFLWNASKRLTDTTSELRHVLDMSHDLAATMDPHDVGNALARHIASVAHADECVLSTWDREADRVVTFGLFSTEQPGPLEPWYDLKSYPATRAVLAEMRPYVVDSDNPDADAAEIMYLKEVGHQTLVMVPLVARGESIGIVEMFSSRAHAFSDREIELAQMLAREAAVTFDNARLSEELRLLAYRDSLTGLANRARLQDRVEHALERLRGRSPNHAALLFIDLDNFKNVNDRFGHGKGDTTLQALAERIRATIRPGDTAGRLGGDEFAVLLEDVESPEIVGVICERLLAALSEPVELGEASPIVGASIGYALSGPDCSTSEELLRNADIAMYAAKAGGRGQVVPFRRDLLDTASARAELASMLRGAEARRELQVHFQPVVRMDGAVPVGVEALVRWQPHGDMLHLPAEFIGLAEETGEILPIGRWVVAEGCRRVRAIQERHDLPGLRLYVNLSARQFRDPGLVPMITTALAETGLPARDLTLEITEGTLLTPGFETVERIGELRALGLRLAIDDFGTGYSSLGYLRAFHIDELKIDRSFVPGSSGVGDAKVLSQAIVELGRMLGLEMVAEGIETEEQAAWFRELGCSLAQGFLYAHPMPAAELDRYFRRQSQSMRRSTHTAASDPSTVIARIT
ncbi:MAG TPA: EAL domain-containing protein [Candidatus Limnocylindrales bacterium]|nr:EAL domain-containing protein [Candidatus Limnocylindrales bacterium]